MNLSEAFGASARFKTVYETEKDLIGLSWLLDEINQKTDPSNTKKEYKATEYQHRERVIDRVLYMDREHPVDTVIINDFNRKTGSDLGEVKMIYGPSADEYTRSYHALALAVASKIYFRNGAYRAETEEGRKLLAHELTHIAQNKNKEDYRNVSVQQKEAESEANENNESYNPDPVITRNLCGKEYSLKKSTWQRIHARALEELENKIKMESSTLDDEGCLSLLLKYQKWLKEDASKWERL